MHWLTKCTAWPRPVQVVSQGPQKSGRAKLRFFTFRLPTDRQAPVNVQFTYVHPTRAPGVRALGIQVKLASVQS